MQLPPSNDAGGTGTSVPDAHPFGTGTDTAIQQPPPQQARSQQGSSQQTQSQQSGVGAAAGELASDAKQLGSTAADRIHSEVDARKGNAAGQVRSVSSALERTVGELDQGVPEWMKSAFRQGAQQIERFADALEQRDSRQILNEVQSFARERPALFLGACAAAGFAAARVFRAGGEQASGGQGSQDQWNRETWGSGGEQGFASSSQAEPAFTPSGPGELV